MNDPVIKLIEDFKSLQRAEQSRFIDLMLKFITKRTEESNGQLDKNRK